MRWSAVLRALCVAAAVAACGCHAVAQSAEDDAEDALPAARPSSNWLSLPGLTGSGGSSFDWLTGGMPDRLLYFTGFDIWRHGFDGYAGVQWSPAHMDKQGFILRLSMSEGLDRFVTGNHVYDTVTERFTLQPGYRFKGNNADLQLLAGVELEADLSMLDARPIRLHGDIGARLTTDLWWEPTRLLMLQYSLSVTTIGPAANLRAAAGWRLFDRFWVGPEISLVDDQYGQQYRYGAHLTGLRTSTIEWTLAAGYLRDSFQRDGIYGRIGFVLRPARTPLFDY